MARGKDWRNEAAELYSSYQAKYAYEHNTLGVVPTVAHEKALVAMGEVLAERERDLLASFNAGPIETDIDNFLEVYGGFPKDQAKEMLLRMFRERLAGGAEERLKAITDAAEMLWVVLANVDDWTKQSDEWQKAAARWRDNYFAALATFAAVPRREEPDGH